MPSTPYQAYTNPLHDGRRKLLPSQYEEVRQTYQQLKSFQKTADHYQVSKRLITFIVNPNSLKTLKEHNRKIEHWKKYYNKEQHTIAMRKYREKKKQLKIKAR